MWTIKRRGHRFRDPACGIPPDIHFEIEDNKGTSLGRARCSGRYCTVYRPLKESGDQIRIKNSSMKAFQTMLTYIHDAEMDWEFEELDLIQRLKEVFHIADLAERYNLPRLKKKSIDYAKTFATQRKNCLRLPAWPNSLICIRRFRRPCTRTVSTT